MIPLSRHFIYTIHIRWAEQMPFIYWQIIRFAIDLTSAGKDNLDLWIVMPAGFQDGKLGAAIDLQVCVWILHGIHVAGLSC